MLLGFVSLFSIESAYATTYTYDADGRLKSATNSQGQTATYVYDSRGNLIRIERTATSQLFIESFTPNNGPPGVNVTINGTGFGTATGSNTVTFNGVAAPVLTVSAMQLLVQVPQNASTGKIAVSTGGNTATSDDTFYVTTVGYPPSITGFSPQVANVGGTLTITGQHLYPLPGQTTVEIDGVPVQPQTISDLQITVTVPAYVGSGLITVTTPYGSATTSNAFIVVQPGVVTSNVTTFAPLTMGGASDAVTFSNSSQTSAIVFDGDVGDYISIQASNFSGSGQTSWIVYGPLGYAIASGNISGNYALKPSQPSVHLPRLHLRGKYALFLSDAASGDQVSIAVEKATALAIDGPVFSQPTTQAAQSKRYSFSAIQGQSISIGVRGSTASGFVYLPDGQLLAQIYSEVGLTWDLPNLPQTGLYTVVIAPPGSATMGFDIAVSSYLRSTLTLGSANTVSQTLNSPRPGQEGLISFTATAGQTLAIGISTPLTGSYALGYTLYAPDGSVAISGSPYGGIGTLNLPNLAAGTYALKIGPSYGITTSITVTLAKGAIGNIATDGASVPVQTYVGGQLAYLTFSGTAGDSISFGLSNGTNTANSADWTVVVFKPDGTRLTSTYFGWNYANGSLDLPNLPATGTYTILVAAPVDQTNQLGLTASSGVSTTMAFTATLSHYLTGTLALNGGNTAAQTFTLTRYGQEAQISFTANAGQTFALGVTTTINNDDPYSVYATLFGPTGATLGSTGTHGGIGAINMQNLAAGTYTVRLAPGSGLKGNVTATLAAGSTATLTPVGSAVPLQTWIGGQRSYLTFNANAGDNLKLAISNFAAQNFSGCFLAVVLKPDYSVLATQNICLDQGNSVNFTLSNLATGTYLAMVSVPGDTYSSTPGVTSNQGASATITFNAALSYQGAGVSVSPGSIDFGSQLVNAASANQTVTVKNVGNSALHVGTPTIGGANSSNFGIANNGCTAAVAAQATCTIAVNFTPSATGTRAGTLQIPSDASNGAQTVSLTGVGAVPGSNLSPTSLSFGNQLINTTSSAQTVTVTNTGTINLHVGALSFIGNNPGDFAVSSNGCSSAVPPNQSCSIGVTFKPTATLGRSASLQIPSDAGSTQSVPVSGTGTAPTEGISPASLSWGNQLINTGVSKSVSVTNSGTAPLHMGVASVSGANVGDFLKGADTCSSVTVQPNSTCSVTVTFNPQATGARSATLNLPSDTNGGAQTVSMSGTGVAPTATITPTSIAFGNQLVNASSAAQTVTVKNTGTSDLHVGVLSLSGTNPTNYVLSSNTCNSTTITAGNQCTVSVSFKPDNTGSRTATLTVPSDTSGGSQSVALSGTGIAPTESASPSSVTFSAQVVGAPSAPQTVTITNTGTAPLHMSAVSISGTNAGDFAKASDNCSSATVAVNGNCTVNVTFTPTAAGSRTASLQLPSDTFGGVQAVALSGTGTAPVATASPTSLSFSAQLINTTSAAKTVTITNTGTAPLHMTTVAIAGTNATDFTKTADSCTLATVAVNGNCSVSVTFKPAAAGARSATLNLPSDTNGGTSSVPLSGTGTAPTESISPTPVSFASQNVNTTSGAQTITVTNTGTAPLHMGTVSISGTNASDFTKSSDACTSVTVAANGTCTVGVTFKPAAMGSRTATLNMPSDTSGGATSVTMSGTGLAASASASPTSIAFGTQLINTASSAQTVTVTNNGNIALTIAAGAVTISGANASDFTKTADSCSGSSVAASGGTCSIGLTFKPAATGSRAGTLQVASNDPSSPLSVALTGTGTAPVESISPSPVSFGNQNVNTTSSAQTITVTNTGTAPLHMGTVSISGTNAADFTKASDNCTSVTVAANGTCTVGVTFKPAAIGSRSGTLNLPSDSNGGVTSVSMTGTGQAALASASPTSLSFGSQLINTTSSALSVTITNSGNIALTIASGAVTITGANASDFTKTADSCSNTSVAANGGTCSISLTFKPAASGARAGTLQIASNDPNSPLLVGLGGNGIAPSISLTPASLGFGNQLINTTSAAQTITVTNTGTAPLHVGALALSGSNPGDFAASGCAAAVSPSQTCTISVTFKPLATGSRGATLSVPSDATNGTQTATLSGTGIAPAISLSSTSIAFGNQLINTASSAQTITVTNGGTAPLHVGALSLSGANPGDFTANGCSSAVSPGQTCTISVTFTPPATGARSATLSVPSDATNGTQTVSLSGTGIAPAISLSSNSIAFGSQLINTASSARTITVTNTGTAPLHVGAMTKSGANPGDFAASGCAAAVAPNSTCTISVTFTPPATGSRGATLSVPSDATNGTQTVSLSGTGIAPAISLSSTSINFGNQLINTTSGALTITVTNSGTSPLHVGALALGGVNPSDFAASGCTAAVSPNQTCTISVTFAPPATGSRTATLSVPSDATNGTQTVSLSGTGVAPAVGVAPASVAFGNQIVNTTSAVQTVTVTNTGTAPLHVGAPALGGSNNSDFAISNNACTSAVAPGANCKLSLTFTPAAMGNRTATLSVPSDGTNGTQSVGLAGTGVAPVISLSTSSLAFSDTLVNQTSAALTVTVSNTGTSDLHMAAPSITGPNGPDFAVTSNTCPAALSANGSCTLRLAFTPMAMGTRSATLQLTSDALNGPQSVALSGTGIAPIASASTDSLTYSNQVVGATSAAQTVTITNTGTAPLHVGSLSTAGANPSDFIISASNCNVALPPMAQCSFGVSFDPSAVGSRSASALVPSDSLNGTVSISLSGTGVEPGPDVTLVPTSLNFGDIPVGTATSRSVSLYNYGTQTLSISAINSALTTSPPDKFNSSNNCGSSLAAGSSCTITVTINPASGGTKSGSLTIISNAPSSPDSASLSANAVAMAPVVSFTPSSLDFGSQAVTTTSATKTVTLANTGTAALKITKIAATSEFGESDNCGTSLAAGGFCTLNVTFKPKTPGKVLGAVAIVSNAASSPDSISLAGTGTVVSGAVVVLNPTAVNFGDVPLNSTSAPKSVTLTNEGGAALTIVSINTDGSASPNQFSETNDCGLTLAPQASCTISVIVAPKYLNTAGSARSGLLSVVTSAQSSPDTVPLSANAVNSAPEVNLDPQSLDFGYQTVGTTATKIVMLENSGTAPLTIRAIQTTPLEYPESNTCPATLNPGNSCSISVTFRPSADVRIDGALTIVTNSSTNPNAVPLTGNGVNGAPTATFNPTSVDFGNQALNSTSAPRDVKLTNNGNYALNITSITAATSTPPNQFSQTNNCASGLAAGASCDINVTFKPTTTTGAKSGTLTVISNTATSPDTVPLSGTAQ